MDPIHPQQRRRRGRIAGRFATLALFLPLALGCGESVHTTTATGPVTNPSADAACAKLAGCDQCFIDQTGQCIGADACAPRLSADTAICVNGISGCNATALGDCLFLGCQGTDATGECQ